METRFSKIKDAIQAAYDESFKEAQEAARYVKSRGKFICTSDNKHEQCRPYVGAEAHDWKGTEKHLTQAVEEILRSHPEVEKLYIEGGFDGADNFRAYCLGDYFPWTSSWDVTIWTRKDGWLF